MHDYDKVLLFIGVQAYLGSLLQGITTFGDAIFFHLAWGVAVRFFPDTMHNTVLGSNDLKLVSLLMSTRAAVASPTFAYLTRKHWQPKLIATAMPINLMFTLFGTWLLHGHSEAPWIKPVLGTTFSACGFFFGFRVARFVWRARRAAAAGNGGAADGPQSPQVVGSAAWSPVSPARPAFPPAVPTDGDEVALSAAPVVAVAAAEEEVAPSAAPTPAPAPAPAPALEIRPYHYATLAVATLFAGISGGLTNVGGPPYMVWAIVHTIPKDVARGIFPVVSACSFQLRFWFALYLGEYDPRWWMAHVINLTGGLAGLLLGNHLSVAMSQQSFAFLVCWLMILGAVALAELSAGWVIAAFVSCAISTVALIWFDRPPPAAE